MCPCALDMKFAVRYGEDATSKRVKLGEGLVGWAALHREPVLVADAYGIFETLNEERVEFGARRVCDAIRAHRHETARSIVDAVFDATGGFRGHAPQNDDMTAAAVKIAA